MENLAALNSGFEYPQRRMTVNLHPAGVRRQGRTQLPDRATTSVPGAPAAVVLDSGPSEPTMDRGGAARTAPPPRFCYLHFKVAPPESNTQLGLVGGVAGKRSSTHWPPIAVGTSSTSVATTGKSVDAAAYVPFSLSN